MPVSLREAETTKNLNGIDVGEYAEIAELLTKGSMRRRLLDIGLTPDTRVECVGKSPAGDPKAFLIRGAVIAIRKEDCNEILIKVQFTRDYTG